MQHLKYYRDLKNVVDTAERVGVEKGIVKGIVKGVVKVAINLKKMGLPISDIVEATGLSEEEILKL